MKGRIGILLTALAVSVVLTTVWAVLAFPDSVLAGKNPNGKGKGGGSLGERVALCVTFDDLEGDRIISDLFDSDGDGSTDPYCDGVLDTVEPDSWIKAHSVGGFALNTASAHETRDRFWRTNELLAVGGRNVVFDFGMEEVPGSGTLPPFETVSAEILMFIPDIPDGVDLRTMLPGESFQSSLRIMFAPTEIARDWRVSFGRFPGGTVPDSDFVLVTAGEDLDLDGFADEWRIQTTGSHVGHLAKLGEGGEGYQASFHLPCGMTLIKAAP